MQGSEEGPLRPQLRRTGLLWGRPGSNSQICWVDRSALTAVLMRLMCESVERQPPVLVWSNDFPPLPDRQLFCTDFYGSQSNFWNTRRNICTSFKACWLHVLLFQSEMHSSSLQNQCQIQYNMQFEIIRPTYVCVRSGRQNMLCSRGCVGRQDICEQILTYVFV
jgi:hypothetical protein